MPLVIVLAPTERQDVFGGFAEALRLVSFGREELNRLPLLSDEGKALQAYAARHHRHHFFVIAIGWKPLDLRG
jgi:hypothetical protein